MHQILSIWLTYINFINLYFKNFSNKKKALGNLSHSCAILAMETKREIDESKAGAKCTCFPVS